MASGRKFPNCPFGATGFVGKRSGPLEAGGPRLAVDGDGKFAHCPFGATCFLGKGSGPLEAGGPRLAVDGGGKFAHCRFGATGFLGERSGPLEAGGPRVARGHLTFLARSVCPSSLTSISVTEPLSSLLKPTSQVFSSAKNVVSDWGNSSMRGRCGASMKR
jgi:hypothetical protein